MAANPEEPVANASLPTSLVRLEELGIVGAGGGGFPAAVKFASRVSQLIVNAAECEPLLHKDKELLHHYAEPFLRGLGMAMEIVGASEAAIGVKEKWGAEAPPEARAREAENAQDWYKSITVDTFG